MGSCLMMIISFLVATLQDFMFFEKVGEANQRSTVFS